MASCCRLSIQRHKEYARRRSHRVNVTTTAAVQSRPRLYNYSHMLLSRQPNIPPRYQRPSRSFPKLEQRASPEKARLCL